MHKKQAKPTKTRAPLIRSCSSKQLTLAEFYYQGLFSQMCRPAKDARMVIGAVIIKHKFCLSDAETVQQIQENPYMQYFVGLPGYQMEARSRLHSL